MKKAFYQFNLLMFLFGYTSLFAQNILYVGGGSSRTTASVSDIAGMNYLDGAGYIVSYQDDDSLNDPTESPDTAGIDIVVISSSVSSSKILKCAWIDKPIVTWEPAAYDDFGLVLNPPNVYGTITEPTFSIINLYGTHPILSGFSDTIPLSYSNNSFAAISPFFVGGSTKMETRFVSDTNNPQTYAPMAFFEKGDTFNYNHSTIAITGRPANGRLPARRIATFMTNDSFISITPEGLALFLNSVEFGIYGTIKPETPIVPVTGILLNKSTDTITVNSTVQLVATVLPDSAKNKRVNWSTTNTDIATVSNNGLVTGVGDGIASIIAETQDGGFMATANIHVIPVPIPVTDVTIDKSSETILVGNTVQLTATVSPENASNKTVSWSSSADSVATVSPTGLVRGVRAGGAIITVTTQDGHKSKTAAINVTKPLSDISNTALVGYELYPNPVSDILMVKGENIISVSIMNALGSQVLKIDSDIANGIDVSGLNAGLYVVNVSSLEGSVATVIIKK